MYVGALLEANGRSPKPTDAKQPALRALCQDPRYLSALIGGSLDGPVHSTMQERYLRVAALRNSVMHRGVLTYVAVVDGKQISGNGEEFEAHLEHVIALIDYIEMRIGEAGHIGISRGSALGRRTSDQSVRT